MCNIGIQKHSIARALRLLGIAVFLGLVSVISWATHKPLSHDSNVKEVSVQYASADTWSKYRDIKLKNNKTPSPAKSTPSVPKAVESSKSVFDKNVVEKIQGLSYKSQLKCPITPNFENSRYIWLVCTLSGSTETKLTPYGVDFPVSIFVPKSLGMDNKGRLHVFLHPDDRGGARFVKDRSSNQFQYDQIEIHPAESYYGTGGGITGWWVYSGNDVGKVKNYNGNQIAASIDYVLKTYPDKLDLNKGIHLRGTSLGGAGVMHQSMVLPKYQDKIAIVDALIALVMIPKNHEVTVKPAWGTKEENPEIYDSVDIRTQWKKVQNIHFSWRGGANDGLGRFDLEFIHICEQRKISCSLAWLQSGHSIIEVGYSMDMSLFTDPNQDVSLDKILPVITDNTSNYHGKLRGYHNRGISWNYAKIIDVTEKIEIPLKYLAQKNLGPDLPDQPDTVRFSITPRHVAHFKAAPGNRVSWVFGEQSGTTVVKNDGLFTIKGLELRSGDSYQLLSIQQQPRTSKAAIMTGSLSSSIVYTRVARTVGEHKVVVNGKDHILTKADLWDKLPGVGRKFGRFNAPGQLVLQDQQGNETIIFDCMVNRQPCVPLDPMVSLDGTKIAFSVYRAANLENGRHDRVILPNILLARKHQESQIYIYNLKNRSLSQWPTLSGVNDFSPAWLPDGRVIFSSTRRGYFRPKLNVIGTGKEKEPRLFIADADGSNVVDVSPHEITAAMHPYVLNSGRVAYSSHWMSHNLAYNSTNGGINWPGTVDNMWVLMDSDYQGGDMTALLGAHKHNIRTAKGRTKTMKAFHFLGQRKNDDICVANYYRSNNLGLGDVWCWPPEPKGVEGMLPTFLPRGVYNVAEWSKSNDEPSFTESRLGIGKRGRTYLGKIGYPEGTVDGQLLLTVGRGYCSQIAASVEHSQEKLGDQPGCDVGLYKTTTIPSRHPDDLTLVVDKPEWHEFGARIVRARTVAAPLLSKSGDQSCILVSSDAGSAETALHRRYKFNNNYFNSANHGGEIDGISHSELAAIRFWSIQPNQSNRLNFRNSIGNPVKLLGDASLLADKSFSAKLPCNVPYIMAGVDKNGRVIKRDQIPQSLRPGEKRVCSGCHLHSKQGRPYEQSQAFSAKPVDLTRSIPVPTYQKNIQPIFKARCSSCHTDDVPLMNYEKLVWDYFQTHVPDTRKIKVSQKGNSKRMYGLHRPYTSKYVNNMFARESLLYWKAANKRTDGRADDTYSDDIDFGADHPTNISATELKTIGDWLDSGATK